MCTRFDSLPGVFMAAGAMLSAAAYGSPDLEVRIADTEGNAVEHAVVAVHAPGDAGTPATAVVDQIDKTFVPHVLAVEVGTRVSFPNSDAIRHHVYSFSDAKSFELPLYEGVPAEPVLFDRPGVVALGCNIHDQMSAYIFVSETPFTAISGTDGIARVTDLPPGTHVVEVWHPRQKRRTDPKTLDFEDGAALRIDVELELKPEIRIERGPATRRRRY